MLGVTVMPMADSPAATGSSRLAGARRWVSPEATAPTWAGLVTAAVGFGLLAYAWGKVAGLTNVALQVPYVISAGFTGLGLIAVGCTLVAVQARRQDAAARDQRLAELGEVLEALERLSTEPVRRVPSRRPRREAAAG